MSQINHYRSKAQSRKMRVRSSLHGTAQRPRLTVYRSNKYLSAQVIDDDAGKTLASVHEKSLPTSQKKGTKSDRAVVLGKSIVEKMSKNKIKAVVFDRGSYRYHGRIRHLADAVREAGITF